MSNTDASGIDVNAGAQPMGVADALLLKTTS
jgi:hypothetical protein